MRPEKSMRKKPFWEENERITIIFRIVKVRSTQQSGIITHYNHDQKGVFYMRLKYMILGAGGTGGILGAALTKAGKDVTFIARGSNLETMRNNGLIIRHLWDQMEEHLEVRALSMEESCALSLAPDVIFICVKGYSLDSVLPFIRQTAGPRTIIIPILNIYGTGARMQKELPDCTVLDGCIYVSASLEHPGILVQHGPILKVVFGPRDPSYISPAAHNSCPQRFYYS